MRAKCDYPYHEPRPRTCAVCGLGPCSRQNGPSAERRRVEALEMDLLNGATEYQMLMDQFDAERRKNRDICEALIAEQEERRKLQKALDAERRRATELERLLTDCTDDLEEEIQSRHPAYAEANYPDERRRYERDMAPVYRARAALEKKP